MIVLRRRGGDGGQATVELALVLPLILVVLLLLVQVGLVLRDRLALGNSCAAAARAAVVDPSGATSVAAAREAANLDSSRLIVSLSPTNRPGALVTVVCRYRSRTDLAVVGGFVPDVDMGEELVVRAEEAPT